MQPGNDYALLQMRLFESLVRELDTWPAELRAFENQYESFGSWELVVRRNGVRTRFQFDGKERWLFAHRLQPDAGDYSVSPKRLTEIAFPNGLTTESLPLLIDFVRSTTGGLK